MWWVAASVFCRVLLLPLRRQCFLGDWLDGGIMCAF